MGCMGSGDAATRGALCMGNGMGMAVATTGMCMGTSMRGARAAAGIAAAVLRCLCGLFCFGGTKTWPSLSAFMSLMITARISSVEEAGQRVLLALLLAAAPISRDLDAGLVHVLDLDDAHEAGLARRVALQHHPLPAFRQEARAHGGSLARRHGHPPGTESYLRLPKIIFVLHR